MQLGYSKDGERCIRLVLFLNFIQRKKVLRFSQFLRCVVFQNLFNLNSEEPVSERLKTLIKKGSVLRNIAKHYTALAAFTVCSALLFLIYNNSVRQTLFLNK